MLVSTCQRAYLLAQVATTLGVLTVSLRRGTSHDNLRWIIPDTEEVQGDLRQLERVVRYVDRLLFKFPLPGPQGRCVPRALTIARFARAMGFEARVHFGIRKDGKGLEGHAWVSIDGQAVFEPAGHVDQYAPTYSYPLDVAVR